MLRRHCLLAPLAATLALLTACGAEPEPPPPSGGEALEVRPTLVDDVVVSGGSLLINVEGTDLLVPQTVALTFRGDVGGAAVDDFILADWARTERALHLEVPWSELESVLGATGGSSFTGDIEVNVQDIGGTLEGVGTIASTQVRFEDAIAPSIAVPVDFEIFLNHLSEWDASGVLREGEGETRLRVEGTFTTDQGEERPISAEAPVAIGAGGREEAIVNWAPWVFGVRPGTFVGTVRPINAHTSGVTREGSATGVAISLRPTEFDGFVEPAASRGEIATAIGRGFIAADPERGQSMFFTFEGTYYLMDGSELDLVGDDVVRLAPETVPTFTEAQIVLRTETEDRSGAPRLTGLTATPGTFEGTVTPTLVDGSETVTGEPWTGQFTITPTRQVVYVKFLPGFSTSLDVYGLRNVEREVRERIDAVLTRDYADWHVEFVYDEPSGFVEYSLIEVGGPDPNGAGLFGLDNTAGKDTGNVRLNDWIGGTNADSGELGYYVFGGVFIESFRAFSPSLDPGSEVAAAEFDEIFAPFMPQLGGTVVDATEWPDGPRTAQIELAIHAFGSVIGNTITHEIGHSLGLAFFPEDEFSPGTRFHNDFDEPGAIMDSGGNRPFEERAELEGTMPPSFNSRNRAYLDRILPRP